MAATATAVRPAVFKLPRPRHRIVLLQVLAVGPRLRCRVFRPILGDLPCIHPRHRQPFDCGASDAICKVSICDGGRLDRFQPARRVSRTSEHPLDLRRLLGLSRLHICCRLVLRQHLADPSGSAPGGAQNGSADDLYPTAL